jgi:hypothetical protein
LRPERIFGVVDPATAGIEMDDALSRGGIPDKDPPLRIGSYAGNWVTGLEKAAYRGG